MSKEAEEYFEKKYGNKLKESESWVIRLMQDFADEQNKLLKAKLERLEEQLMKQLMMHRG